MKPPPPRDGTGEDSFVGQLRSRLWDGEALGVEGGRSFAVPPGGFDDKPLEKFQRRICDARR